MDLSSTNFVKFLKAMVGQPYWYGTCVYKCTSALLSSKAAQYPTHYTSARMPTYKQHVSDKKVCADCVGLAKGFVWTNGGVGVLESIGNDNTYSKGYGTNGCPDKGANGMFTYAKSKGLDYGTIDTIPEIPGIAVTKDGHVGFYIGNGEVVEAEGFSYGIVITKLKNRPWTHWYKFPGIQYTANSEITTTTSPATEYELGGRTLRKGDKGNDVKELQELLIELGYNLPKYGADGSYGAETFNAISEFQRAHKLKVDGICGPNTFEALFVDHGTDDSSDALEPSVSSTFDYSGYPTIRNGSTGQYVTILQNHLVHLGYDLGTYGDNKNGVDGKMGAKTVNAVRAF